MILSASQLKTYKLCPRKWWFEKVEKLPRPTKAQYGTVFGKVLHNVLERWLEGDPSGRMPGTGEPIDLFPEGWEVDWETGEEVPPEDQALIKAHVELAIETGMLRRTADQKIEASFTVPLLDDVMFTGRIDLLRKHPPTIEDHKGTKSMRYALSKAKLADDDQMLAYAKILGDQLGLQPEDKIHLAHNVFERTGPCKQRKTEAVIEFKTALDRWEEFKTRAHDMIKHSQCKKHKEVKVDLGEQCNAYGGCRYLSICSGDETTTKFKRRVLRLAQPQKEGSSVSLEEKLKAKKRKKGRPTPPTTGVNPETNADEIAPVEEQVIPAKKEVEPIPFTLYVGCAPDNLPFLSFNSLFAEAIENPSIYYAKNAFERRDRLCSVAEKVSRGLSHANLVVPAGPLVPDQAAFLAALEPYAAQVVRALA